MLKNAYLLAKIGADTAENEQHFAEILPIGRERLPVSCVARMSVEGIKTNIGTYRSWTWLQVRAIASGPGFYVGQHDYANGFCVGQLNLPTRK